MFDLFSSIPVRMQGVTGSYVQTQRHMCARDLFTGLFHVCGGREFALFFQQGKLVGLYKLSENRWESLPPITWDETIPEVAGDLREIALPDEGLRIYRLLLEADFSAARTIPALQANDLIPYLKNWHRGGQAGIAVLHQMNQSAVLLVPADNPEPIEGVLVSGADLRTGPAVVTEVQHWGGRLLQMKLCNNNERSEAWREYNLRVSFRQFIQGALKRYEELAGRFLVADLGTQINLETHDRGWAISLFGNTLSVRQFFQTAEAAGRAFTVLLDGISRQMDSVVGRKMTETILSNATRQLNDDARLLLQDCVLSKISSNQRAFEVLSHD